MGLHQSISQQSPVYSRNWLRNTCVSLLIVSCQMIDDKSLALHDRGLNIHIPVCGCTSTAVVDSDSACMQQFIFYIKLPMFCMAVMLLIPLAFVKYASLLSLLISLFPWNQNAQDSLWLASLPKKKLNALSFKHESTECIQLRSLWRT